MVKTPRNALCFRLVKKEIPSPANIFGESFAIFGSKAQVQRGQVRDQIFEELRDRHASPHYQSR